jgi:hypothetical protein
VVVKRVILREKNTVLRGIFGPKWDENMKRRRHHNGELRSLYRPSNIVRMIKSRILRWADRIAGMEVSRSVFFSKF